MYERRGTKEWSNGIEACGHELKQQEIRICDLRKKEMYLKNLPGSMSFLWFNDRIIDWPIDIMLRNSSSTSRHREW